MINKEKLTSELDIIFKIKDCNSICNQIDVMKDLLKKDESFVINTFKSLDEDSKDIFSKILDYLDGSIYLCSIWKKSDGDMKSFIDLLSLGWTSDTYDKFEEFRAQQFRNPIICETTDLYTETKNESEDADFDSIKDYLRDNYGTIDDFFLSTVKDYYFENINELLTNLNIT
jgi:hypothetical protein